MSFKVSVFLLIFSLDDLSIEERQVLKSPTIIVLLSISPFRSVNSDFIYLVAPMLGAEIFTNVIFLLGIPLYHYIMTFFVSYYSHCLKV